MEDIVQRLISADLVQFGSGDVRALFCPETLQVFRLSELTAKALADIRGGDSLEDVCGRYSLGRDAVIGLLNAILAQIGQSPSAVSPQARTPDSPLGPELLKLVFMVNNYCNLACSYCYEHETVFKQKSEDMSPEVVRTSLDKFYDSFSRVDELMFIGGEPTLSESIIEYACTRATEVAAERGVRPPTFSMISNGARVSERMFDILGKFGVQVTFSIDGPKKLHNLVRVRHDGSGSYDEVAENIKRYAATQGEKLNIECTLTGAHLQQGVTVNSLLEFFEREFGARRPHIAAAGLPKSHPYYPYGSSPQSGDALETQYERAIKTSLDHLLAPDDDASGLEGALDFVADMLRILGRRKGSNHMCPAGVEQLVVDAKGDIYPCWMFDGMPQFRMGNVLESDVFNESALRVLKRIHDNDKRRNPQCSVCYARYVCHSCLGNNQNTCGSIEQIDEQFCDTVRGSLRAVVLRLVDLQGNPERWGRLKTRIARVQETIRL